MTRWTRCARPFVQRSNILQRLQGTRSSTEHPCSHILRITHEFAAYTMNGEHQKKLRAIRFRKARKAKFVPTSIPILQSAVTPNGIVTHVAQQIHCNSPFAKRWRIRPPSLNLGCPAPLLAKRRGLSRAAGLQLL